MSNIDPVGLVDALDRLGALTEATPTEESLLRVIDAIVALYGVTGAGLMFLDDSSVLRYVLATDSASRALEAAQEELGRGPCVDSLVLDRHILTGDLAEDDRWPGLAELVAPGGVRAVLGVPLRVGGTAVGSLNVYYDRPHAWDQSEVQGLTEFNRIIESLLGQALLAHRHGEVVNQLQYALDNRVVIERAVGYLMGAEGLDAVTAFDRLRRMARASRRKVAEVANEVLARAPRPGQ
jgi:GAF domain-containing protein